MTQSQNTAPPPHQPPLELAALVGIDWADQEHAVCLSAAAFGTDRERFPDADSLSRLSGLAPVTRQSGRMRTVRYRRAWLQLPLER